MANKTRKTAPKLTKKQMERKRGGELISWNRPGRRKGVSMSDVIALPFAIVAAFMRRGQPARRKG